MSTENMIIPKGIGQNEMINGLSKKGWKVVGSTVAGILFTFGGNAQCLNQVIDTEFQNDQAYINQDEVLYTSQGDLWVTLGSNTGNKFELYKNGVLQGPGQISFGQGDQVRIIPKNPGVANLEIITDEPGCNNWAENNEAMAQILPIKRSKIDAYVRNGELRVDAEAGQAVNVDYVDMEVSVDGRDFVTEDTEKAINSNTAQQYRFSVPVDELIKKYRILKPTVFYTRLTNHDFDGKTETSDVYAVEISPDGTVTPLSMYPNIAFNAEHITFTLGGDAETLYPIRIVELTTGHVINETFVGGAQLYKLSDITGSNQLTSGNYALQVMLGNRIQSQRFVVVNSQ